MATRKSSKKKSAGKKKSAKKARTRGKNTKQTSPGVASKASKILRSKRSTPLQKSVAASDLAQAGGKKRGRRR